MEALPETCLHEALTDDWSTSDLSDGSLDALPGVAVETGARASSGQRSDPGDAPDATTQICACRNVTRAQVEAAVANGATTLAEVRGATGAGTGCGGCLRKVMPILKGEGDAVPALQARTREDPAAGIRDWLRTAFASWAPKPRRSC
jgi:bacterioferritin-associated ferredoxin